MKGNVLPAMRPSLPSMRRSVGNQGITLCAATASANGNRKPGMTINKPPLTLTGDMYEYLLRHNAEPQVMSEVREDTKSMQDSTMQVAPEQARYMAWMVETLQAKRAIEIGVFSGYSSLAVALALPDDGELYAIDRDRRIMDVATQFWEKAGVSHKVIPRIGSGEEEINRMVEEEPPASFDFVFIDADKLGYDHYYESALKLLKAGGVVMLDNMLWTGKVADYSVQDEITSHIRNLNEKIFNDDRVSSTLLQIGDGVVICRKL